jgi:Ca2+-binding EF-hand superfamily protein
MTNQFSNDQIKEIQQAFKLFDKDNDGHLTR